MVTSFGWNNEGKNYDFYSTDHSHLNSAAYRAYLKHHLQHLQLLECCQSEQGAEHYGQDPQAAMSSNRSATFTSPSPSRSAAHTVGQATSLHDTSSPANDPLALKQSCVVAGRQPVVTQHAPVPGSPHGLESQPFPSP